MRFKISITLRLPSIPSRMLFLVALAAGSVAGCKPADVTTAPASAYDDCVLGSIKGTMNEQVIRTIKTACAQKFPLVHDFDLLAKKQGMQRTWAEVLEHAEYGSLNDEEKAYAEETYFSKLQPAVHPDFVQTAREQFAVFAKKAARDAKNVVPAPPSRDSSRASTLTKNEVELGEDFGAALAAAEAIRILAEETSCRYIFKKPLLSYEAQATNMLSQAPRSVQVQLSVFADQTTSPAKKLRQASSDIVAETLHNMRANMQLDDRTACGATAGMLLAGLKATSENWQSAVNISQK